MYSKEFENALNWGVPKRKYVYSILLRYWYWIAGTMICTGFFLFGTLFPSQYKNTSYREEHVSLEDTALILGEIANRVNFDFAVSEAKERGVKKLSLSVRKDNERAIGFYKRNGFVSEGSDPMLLYIDGEYVDGEHFGLILK